MKRLRAAAFVAAVAAAACGGEQSSMPAAISGGSPAYAPAASGTRGDLLYVGHTMRVDHEYHGRLTVLTFPYGEPFAAADLPGFATGVCSDTAGNVWVVVRQRYESNAYEFAHGGVSPIAKLRIERPHGFTADCSVDPNTGNLAVLVGGAPSGPMGYAEIWAHAQGEPARFALPFTPTACTYDMYGNLFVDGWIGDTVLFELAELANGSQSFSQVPLDKPPANYPGGMRWAGRYLDIADNNFSGSAKIYRVSISGSHGRVAGTIHMRGLYYASVFDVDDKLLAGTDNRGFVSLWAYPAGGSVVKRLAEFKYAPHGIAISVGSLNRRLGGKDDAF